MSVKILEMSSYLDLVAAIISCSTTRLVMEGLNTTLTNRVDTRYSIQAVYASHILLYEFHSAINVWVEN